MKDIYLWEALVDAEYIIGSLASQVNEFKAYLSLVHAIGYLYEQRCQENFYEKRPL